MPLVRMLPDRWQKFIHEALTFGAVGGINTVINYGVFNALALTIFATGQLKATVIATVVATTSSYLMNRHWTYRDRPKSAMRREYTLFFLLNGAGLVIELGALALAKYGLGIDGLLALNVAKTGGLALATVFRFWSYRTFVFRPATAGSAPTADGPAVDGAALDTGVRLSDPQSPTSDATIEQLAPFEAEFTDSLDVALEAELAVELDAADRRPASR